MAAWTPGSYRIRDFSRHVVDLTAKTAIRELQIAKLTKNTWRVYTDGQRRIVVSYQVYAFEPSPRASLVDKDGAMLNGASVFLYPEGMESEESLVVINLPRDWRQVTSSLPWVGGRSPVFRAPNLDVLIDSPIMLGNHTVLEFDAGGVPHRYALAGQGNYNAERLLYDSGKIFTNSFCRMESCL